MAQIDGLQIKFVMNVSLGAIADLLERHTGEEYTADDVENSWHDERLKDLLLDEVPMNEIALRVEDTAGIEIGYGY